LRPSKRGRARGEILVAAARRRTTSIASGRAVFTPSIASEILNLHPRTLMIYESESLIKPQRTATNRRRYSEDDIRRVRVIQFLTRQKGVNLAGVKYVLRLLQALGGQGLSTSEVQELDALDEVAGPSLSA
jgi:DNA-binding transcriptional MerR regulator